MKKTLTFLIVTGLLAGSPVVAMAGHGARGAGYDYAKVVRVEPQIRIVQVSEPREECWEETVTRYRGDDGGYRSYTPPILGGILGGVVGNQFGGGRGKDVMTIAGTVLGASVGRDASAHSRRHARPYRATERHCEVRDYLREEERIDGYRVTYRYDGREYTQHMDYDPGKRVRVRVSVHAVGH